MSKSRATQRYRGAVNGLSVLYALFLFGAVALFQRGLLHGPFGYLIAVLPALPIVGLIAAIGRYLVEETDEYQRLLVTRQALVASGFALTVATLWGFLQSFDLAPRVESYWIAVLWFVGLGLGDVANRLVARREA